MAWALRRLLAGEHQASATGTPAARMTVFACSLCMASAEASTPEWV